MRRLSRWALRIIATVTLLLVAIVLAAWIAMRGSLPVLNGTNTLAGLSHAATIERDANGVATVVAANRLDLSRALGYLHAQERFFEMDLTRRSAAGELAGLFGEAALPVDRRHRIHRFRARAERWWAALSAVDRGLMQAYADGVNAGLADRRVRPWPYLLLRTQPTAWRAEDGFLVVLAMFFDLQDEQNERERDLDLAHRTLPSTVFDFIVRGGTEWDAPIVGAPVAEPPLPSPAYLDLRSLPAVPGDENAPLDGDIAGSNSFAVAGRLTAHGRAIVANDMHLGLRVPNIWFRARLIHGEGDDRVDVQGVTLPGVPAVVVGSNGHIAWAFTNSYGDWLDFVRLEVDPEHPDRYRTANGWRDFERHEERIAIGRDEPASDHPEGVAGEGRSDPARPVERANDGTTETVFPDSTSSTSAEMLVVRDTIWGPVVGEDADGAPLALAWTAHRDGAVNMDMLALEAVRDIDAAITVAARSGVPAQNFIVGDSQGRIAWTIAGRMPRRAPEFDATLPVAGATLAGDLWQGWLIAEAYPRVVDPPTGRLWTANARVVDGHMLALVGDGGYDNGARAGQIRDGLSARDQFDESALLAIQLDDRARLMERWWRLLIELISRTPDDESTKDLLEAAKVWDGCACIDSVSYRMARAFRLYVHEAVMRGLEAPMRERDPDFRWPRMGQNEGVVWQLLRDRPAHLLPPPHASWDDLLVVQARRVAETLGKQSGGLGERSWGEANTVRIRHPVSLVLPAFLGDRLDMTPQPLPGDSHMPRVQGVNFGASQRMVVAPGRETEAIMHMPGGQSGHPLSPYYGAGHDDWAHGLPTPMPPSNPRWHLELVPEN